MNNTELTRRVRASMNRQVSERGFAAPVDVLMDIGVLDRKKYEDWRFGRVPYLEAVCTMNLHKLSYASHQMRVYAIMSGWKPSVTYYKRWGTKGKKIPLRFSKSRNENVERWYATHFVDSGRASALRQARNQKGQKAEPAEAGEPAAPAPSDAPQSGGKTVAARRQNPRKTAAAVPEQKAGRNGQRPG